MNKKLLHGSSDESNRADIIMGIHVKPNGHHKLTILKNRLGRTIRVMSIKILKRVYHCPVHKKEVGKSFEKCYCGKKYKSYLQMLNSGVINNGKS